VTEFAEYLSSLKIKRSNTISRESAEFILRRLGYPTRVLADRKRNGYLEAELLASRHEFPLQLAVVGDTLPMKQCTFQSFYGSFTRHPLWKCWNEMDESEFGRGLLFRVEGERRPYILHDYATRSGRAYKHVTVEIGICGQVVYVETLQDFMADFVLTPAGKTCSYRE